MAGVECREAGCTLEEQCLAGGRNHLALLRERSTLLQMSSKMQLSALLRDSCSPVVLLFSLFLLELSKDPLVFSEKIKRLLYTHSLRFIKINLLINFDFCNKLLIQSGFTFLDECCFELTFYFLM